MHFSDTSRRIGFYSGILAGIGYFIFGVLTVLDPLPSRNTDPAGFWSNLSTDGSIYMIRALCFVFANLIAIALFVSLWRMLREKENEELLDLITVIGILGLVIQALSFAELISFTFTVGEHYNELAENNRGSIHALAAHQLDRMAIVRHTLLGIYFILIARIGMVQGSIPNYLGIIIIIGGIDLILFIINIILLDSVLTFAINASAGILGPIVFFGLAFVCKNGEIKED